MIEHRMQTTRIGVIYTPLLIYIELIWYGGDRKIHEVFKIIFFLKYHILTLI